MGVVRIERFALAMALTTLGCIAAHTTEDASIAGDAFDHDVASEPPDAPDGAPERRVCSEALGSGLPAMFGRLDGRLVSVIPPGTTTCHGDPDHLRLQILVGSAIYEIAVTMRSSNPLTPDVFLGSVDRALPGPPFADGFHTGVTLDYTTLGARSGDLVALTEFELTASVEASLADVDHVSVFATGYATGEGAHLVHRNGRSNDGAIVLHPLAPSSPILVFRFADQAF